MQAVSVSIAAGTVYSVEAGSVAKRSGHREVWRAGVAASMLVSGPGGQVFAAGGQGDAGFIAKLNADGSLAASVPAGGRIRAIAVDESGAVYIAGDGYVRKLDSQLQPVFNQTTRGSIRSLVVDRAGSVYAAEGDGQSATLSKLAPDGSTWLYRADLGSAIPADLTLDSRGCAFVVGATTSQSFAVKGAAQDHLRGASDAFVAKLDADGQLLWSTYLGGNGMDSAASIAFSQDGNVIVTGATNSGDFPASAASVRPWNGGDDGFIAQLDEQGVLIRSSFLGRPNHATVHLWGPVNRADTLTGIVQRALQPEGGLSLADACSITVSNTNDSGAGSLRQAVADAAGCATTSTIDFSVTGTIALSSRILISTSLNIQGPGPQQLIISGRNSNRIFFVGSGTLAAFNGSVHINDMTLANGFGKGGNSGFGGAGAGMGGAIFQNGGTLTIGNVLFSGNTAQGGSDRTFSGDGGGGFGGDSPQNGTGASGGDLGGAGGAVGADSRTGLAGAGGDGGPGAGGGRGGLGPRINSLTTDSGPGGAGGFGGGAGEEGSGEECNSSDSRPNGDGGFGGGQSESECHHSNLSFGGELGAGAGFGGGIFSLAGTLNMTNSTFEESKSFGGAEFRQAQGKGGALFIYIDALVNSTTNLHFVGSVAPQAGVDSQRAFYPDTNLHHCPGADDVNVCGSVPGTLLNDSAALVAGDNQSVLAGRTYPVALQVRITNGGNPVPGLPVSFTVHATGAAAGTFPGGVSIVVVLTDGSGIATAPTLTSNGSAGSFTVTAAGVTFHFTNTAIAAVTPNAGTTPQTKVVATQFNTLSATVTDNSGNLVSGVDVTFTAPSSGATGTFGGSSHTATVSTNSFGIATPPAFTANTVAGTYNVTATTAGVTGTFVLTNSAGTPSSMTANPGTTPQTTAVNTAFTALSVTVKDSFGNAVPGLNVVFTAPGSGASGVFGNSTNTITLQTDSLGVASAPFTANSTGGGPYNVTASSGTLSPVTFSLTNTAAPAIVTNPISQTVPALSTVTFTASASGFPTPTVQWQVSNNGGTSYTPIANATSTTLSFTATGTQNGNLYRAVFTNSINSATTNAATLTVTKLTPTITWNNPADISAGTPLSGTQLNATASVPGGFVYTPPAGTVLGVGNGQSLSVLFTPTDTANYSTASATVHINVLPQVSVTTVAAAAGQYSDPVTLSAALSANATGLVQFQVAGSNVGPAIPVTNGGIVSIPYTITNAAGAYTITATFTSTTPNVMGSSGFNTLTVSKEDATITPATSNPASVQVSTPGGMANTITLTGSIHEAADGSLGDISKALVTVSLVPAVSGTPTVTCTVSNVSGALTATCSNVAVNAYTVQWNITGNYYQGPQVNTVLAVYDPSLGFVTGSGSVVNNGVKGDFAISVKYQKGGSLNGGISYVEHRSTGDFTVSSTSLTSMSIVGATAVVEGLATVNGAGSYSMQAIITDNGEPGINHDKFGLQVPPAVSFSPLTITSGNIQVH